MQDRHKNAQTNAQSVLRAIGSSHARQQVWTKAGQGAKVLEDMRDHNRQRRKNTILFRTDDRQRHVGGEVRHRVGGRDGKNLDARYILFQSSQGGRGHLHGSSQEHGKEGSCYPKCASKMHPIISPTLTYCTYEVTKKYLA